MHLRMIFQEYHHVRLAQQCTQYVRAATRLGRERAGNCGAYCGLGASLHEGSKSSHI
jgi:hypothetical protein